MSWHEFSSSSFSSFMVALSRQHCSCPLSNYVSKLISNLLSTSSDVNFRSMESVSVLSFSDFIFSISLTSSYLFNTLWWLICSSTSFARLVCSSTFDKLYSPLAIQSCAYCAGKLFLFDIDAKYQYSFSTFFLM